MSFLDKNGVEQLWQRILALANTKVPTSRTINGKSLLNDVELKPSDIGAAAAHNHDEYYTVTEMDAKLLEKAPAGFGLGTVAKDISGTDLLDTLKSAKSGLYRGQNVTNAPSESWYYFQVMCDNSKYSTVLAYRYGGVIYKASLSETNGFSQWYKIYDEQNPLNATDVGAMPIIDAQSSDYNMDNILKSGVHYGVYQTNDSTVGTPYYYDNTTFSNVKRSLIVSYSGKTGYGFQIAMPNGKDFMLTRSCFNNTISSWQRYYNVAEMDAIVSDLEDAINDRAEKTHTHEIADVNSLQSTLSEKAPTSHASSYTTYGKATSSNYGHVKLSDSTSSTSGVSGGVAATPAAVKTVYDTLETNKADKSSHNIYTYTALSDIGLSDSDMIAEDASSFAANLTKIVYACPSRAFMMCLVGGSSTNVNFGNSLRAKLDSDIGTDYVNKSITVRCLITSFGGTSTPGKIEVVCDHSDYSRIYTAQFDGWTPTGGTAGIYVRPFIMSYTRSGFLPLDGGTLVGDTVKFKNGLGKIYTDASLLQLSAYNVADAAANSSHLQILNNAQSVAKTLQLVDYDADGKRTDYLVYGQHNKPTAADVGALALDGSNSMTGNLTIEKNTPIVKLRDSATEAGGLLFAANNRVYMQAANVYNSDNNRRQLQLADSDAQTLNRALFLVDIVDGTATGYNVYHEANKPTAADVGVSNENLLDNWYWLDPINSRGQTSYTGSYAFDRWHCGSNVSTVAWEFVEGKGIKITNNGTASVYVRQRTESGYPDGRYTVSILVTEITNSVSMYMSNNNGNTVNSALKTVSSTGLHTVTKDVTNFDRVQFTIPAGASVTIAAVKLECGSVQTLAHQDTSGNWVVNDCPPNKYMETLKCIQSTAVDNDTYANHTIYHSGNMTLDEIGAMPSQIGDVKKTLRTDLGSSWALADGANVAYDAAIAPYLPVTTGVAHYTAAAGYMGSGTTNPNRANLSYANGYYIVSGYENYTTSSDTWVIYMKPTSTSSTTKFVEDPNNEDTGHLETRTFIDVIYYNKVYYALCSDGKIYYYSSTGAPSSWSTTRSYNCTISDSYRLMMINSIPHIVAKDGLYKLTSLTTSSMTSTKVISTPSYVSGFHSFSYVNGNAIWSRYVNESSGTDHNDIAYCVYDGSTAGSISTSSCNFNDGTWLSDKRYSIIGFTYVDGVYYAVATNHSYKVGESLAGFSSCFTNELKSTIDYDTYHIVSFARTKFGTTVAVTTKGEDEDVVCVISSNDATSDISNITDWSVIDTEGYYTSDSDYKYCYLPMVGFYEHHYNNKERFTYFMHSSLDGNARRNNLCRITVEKKLPVIETEKGINTYIKVQ